MRPRVSGGDFPPRVAVDDDVCAFASEVFAADALFPAFAALALFALVVLVDFAFHERFHFLFALAGLHFLVTGEVGFQGEEAGLHADGDVLVFFGRGDDVEGEDGGRVLEPGDDVPAGGLEDFDVPVESATEETLAVVGEGEGGHGLLVVTQHVDGLCCYDVEDADDIVACRQDGGARRHGKN